MFIPPAPLLPTRLRSLPETFLVLRRNPLELWGPPAYALDIAEGRFLGRQQMLLNAPEAIRHVLVSNPGNYRRTKAARAVLQPILGEGLLLAEGEAWRHQRRVVAPAFAPRAMPVLADHVLACCEAAEAALAARLHRPITLLADMQALALDIAARSMFSLEAEDFAAGLRAMILDYGLNFARPGVADLLPVDVPSPLRRGRAAFRARWLAFLDQVIAGRAALPVDAERPRDLFDMLRAARDPETGAGFSQDELRDEISTMIIAGHETTAVTLFWALYLAASVPEMQARMADEARAAGVDGHDALARLPLVRAHIDETLRLYPPAFMIVREAIEADEVLGRAVAPGTVVMISPWVLHRHRKLWRDPGVYDPARFLPGAPPPERFAYLPFGAGPRVCVGASFALTEAVLVLARLLARFEISLCGPATVLPRGLVTTQPDRDVRFSLSARPN